MNVQRIPEERILAKGGLPSLNETSRRERILFILIALLGGAGLIYGWRVFWFLTDDAYIAFRYVSNSHLGYGYVWNAPPFLPVEGYTSFLWVALLDMVWRFTGIEPPASANWIALAFSYGTLLLGTGMILRIRWHSRLRSLRLVFVALLVLFLLFNRTFLAWSSSGLETALFDFVLCLWVYVMLRDTSDSRRACLGALTAACLALTRPDGLLFCAATLIIVAGSAVAGVETHRRRRVLLYGLLPFGIVVIHQAWRLSFYGEWLPNTYYAKMIGLWPQSGLRYVLSFALEYSVWFAGIFVSWAVIKIGMNWIANRRMPGELPAGLAGNRRGVEVPLVVVGALLAHLGYYTIIVGGDHFEYRVYAHLMPLIFVALAWSLNSLRMNPAPAIAAALAFVLLSMPVQWTHWAATKNLRTRAGTHIMRVPIAPHWPQPFRWYAEAFDRSQAWLIYHHVCMRHQEHKIFWQTQLETYDSREKGLQLPRDGYPVYQTRCVGVPSWVMPRVNIIDRFGLNDYTIARTPIPGSAARFMAHDRHPLRGYIESYRPNVEVYGRRTLIEKRTPPMTGEYITETERRWREKIEVLKHVR